MMEADRPEVRSDTKVQEFLVNESFSNEGNPNFGWKDRLFMRSEPNDRSVAPARLMLDDNVRWLAHL